MQVLDHIDDAALDDLVRRDEFFWLDVGAPSDEQVHALTDRFGWHRTVTQDLLRFDQRPHIDDFRTYMKVVFYGARKGDDGRVALTEVHLMVSGGYVITLRQEPCHQLSELQKRFEADRPGSEQFVVYKILDELTDSFLPIVDRIDDEIDELEDRIVEGARRDQQQQIFTLKRDLVGLRRVITPQRDLAARTMEDIVDLPGLDPDKKDYFRDVYDHLIRIGERIDSERDLLSGLLDMYLSTVSNQMNEVMKRLTVVATIFLPITALTGFFGQNFGWLVDNIGSFWTFLVFGVGGVVGASIVLGWWIRRHAS